MTHQFDTSGYIIVPDDHPRLMDKDSIESVKREAYNQAIENAVVAIERREIRPSIFGNRTALRIQKMVKELKRNETTTR